MENLNNNTEQPVIVINREDYDLDIQGIRSIMMKGLEGSEDVYQLLYKGFVSGELDYSGIADRVLAAKVLNNDNESFVRYAVSLAHPSEEMSVRRQFGILFIKHLNKIFRK